MATYILYNVGYGDIDESDVYASMWFSSLYMLLGVSFVGWAQGLFAANILMAKEKWYENIILKKQFKEEMQRTPYNFIFIFLKHKKYRPIIYITIFITVSTWCTWYLADPDMVFIEAFYFAMGSLTTAGVRALPTDVSDDWQYAMVGIFVALGIPLMGVAIATIVSLFIVEGHDDIEGMMNTIRQPITTQELYSLKQHIDMRVNTGMSV